MPNNQQYQIGPFCVNRSLNQLTHNGQVIKLEPKAIDLLLFLAQQPQQLASREDIRQFIWGHTNVTDHAVNRLISHLRKSMDDTQQPYQLIETVPKRGYRLIADVTPLTPATKANKPYLKYGFVAAIVFLMIATFLSINNATIKPFEPSAGVQAVTSKTGREWAPQYSPDGQWISYLHQDFNTHKFQFFVQKTSNTKQHPLLSLDAAINAYTWLDSKATIILSTFENNQCTIKKYTFDTTQVQLTQGKTIFDCGNRPVTKLTYSAYNNSLYWLSGSSDRIGQNNQLHLLSLDEKPPAHDQQALPQINKDIYQVTASPNGQQLILLQQFQWERSVVYLYDIATEQQSKLFATDTLINNISWSREGSQLFYVTNDQFKLHDLDDQQLDLVFSSENQVTDAYFSPTAEQFLYASSVHKYQMQSIALGIPQKIKPVTWAASQDERNPTYSHDGTQLAFISKRSGQFKLLIRQNNGQLNAIATDNLDLSQTLIRWSADDKFLIFHASNALYHYDLTRHQYQKISPDGIYADVVGWSYRSPKQVYLRSDKDGQFNIWRLNPVDKSMTRVTHDGGFSGHESKDGRYFYYTKEKQDGLWRIDLQTNQQTMLSDTFNRHNHLSWYLFKQGIYYVYSNKSSGLNYWRFADNTHHQLWQMPPRHHGGFAITSPFKEAIFGLKTLGESDIMQLKGKM
jgi:DNA-binding winged helix-turn-helix (wHTH) protein/Tol biopolymer transport system component